MFKNVQSIVQDGVNYFEVRGEMCSRIIEMIIALSNFIQMNHLDWVDLQKWFAREGQMG